MNLCGEHAHKAKVDECPYCKLVAERYALSSKLDAATKLKNKLLLDTGKGCSVCGHTPVVNLPDGSGTYWLCGDCVQERMNERDEALSHERELTSREWPQREEALRRITDLQQKLNETVTHAQHLQNCVDSQILEFHAEVENSARKDAQYEATLERVMRDCAKKTDELEREVRALKAKLIAGGNLYAIESERANARSRDSLAYWLERGITQMQSLAPNADPTMRWLLGWLLSNSGIGQVRADEIMEMFK